MNKLKELRIKFSITQWGLAKKLNISQNTISQYENEVNDIPTHILKALAVFYNVSIDYILGLTNIDKPYSESSITLTFKDANRLKEIREDRDLLQKDVAKILDMTQTGYSQYEIGANDISTKVLKKLAYHYNVSIDYLLYLTDERDYHRRK